MIADPFQQGLIAQADTAAGLFGDQLVEQQNFLFGKLDHFASSKNAGLKRAMTLRATTSIFSSSVSSRSGSRSRLVSLYVGRSCSMTRAAPFSSAMRAAREKFFVASAMVMICVVSIVIVDHLMDSLAQRARFYNLISLPFTLRPPRPFPPLW